MEWRNIQRNVTVRFYLYVFLVCFAMVLFVWNLYKFCCTSSSSYDHDISLHQTDIQQLYTGGIVTLHGDIYRKTTQDGVLYVLFAYDGLKIIVENRDGSPVPLGKDVAMTGLVSGFIGSVPVVTIE